MLTVVIPSYNHQAYIKACLDSVCRIDVKNMNVLVIDDGSTDGTVKVVEKFIEDHLDLPIDLVQKKNSGLVSSLNLSVALVETEFLYICASDDIPVPEGIKHCLDILLQEKSCSFIIGGAKSFYNYNDQSDVYGKAQRYFLHLPSDQRYKKSFFSYPSPILIQSTVFRTEALKNIGGWDPELILDDYPFFINLLEKYPTVGVDFKYLPETYTVLYRQHVNNSYRNTFRQYELVSQVISKYAPDKFKNSAIANCAASYILSAIKNKRYRDCISIISKISIGVRFKFSYYIIRQVLTKISAGRY